MRSFSSVVVASFPLYKLSHFCYLYDFIPLTRQFATNSPAPTCRGMPTPISGCINRTLFTRAGTASNTVST
jgi:hypothetical protein